jgi:hypothetical protein
MVSRVLEKLLESVKSLRGRIEILIAILVDEVTPKNEKEEAEIPPRLLNDIV